MDKHKCYISYKFEDKYYRDKIISKYGGHNFIDKSQQEPINSKDPTYIMNVIRRDYLNDSTVTIFLIGEYSGEYYKDEDPNPRHDSQIIIRQEITSSLYDGDNSPRSGLLGIVLPSMYEKVYRGSGVCPICGKSINYVVLNKENVIKEFGQNYYMIDDKHEKCTHYTEEERYAVLVKYDDFMRSPDEYIQKAFDKRSDPVAKKVRVRSFE